jgi:hypothetical protein
MTATALIYWASLNAPLGYLLALASIVGVNILTHAALIGKEKDND